jgi:hypothetical protein
MVQGHGHEIHKLTEGSSPVWESASLVGSGPTSMASPTVYMSLEATYLKALGGYGPIRAGYETRGTSIAAYLCIKY